MARAPRQKRIHRLTPREIVVELDRYIVGQTAAKRAMAIALRNRWRRQQVPDALRDEIAPKNILMIGPTGVGKTEIARRLSKLANAPFIKVEATKFTEVGYVGKDVESMIRELADLGVKMAKEAEEIKVEEKAAGLAEERLLDLLLPKPKSAKAQPPAKVEGAQEGGADDFLNFVQQAFVEGTPDSSTAAPQSAATEAPQPPEDNTTREKLREMLRKGDLDKRMVEIDINPSMGMPMVEVVTSGGLEDLGMNIRDMLSQMMPRGKRYRRVPVEEAMDILYQEEVQKLVDIDAVVRLALDNVEQNGIVFLDEIDKVCSEEGRRGGGEVSREGVQRDLLPIVEGSNVMTKYGMVRTDHVLFVASGAFHVSKPSDLIPELQGRFPIRVELSALTEEDFFRILTEPANSLVKQYVAMMATEKVGLDFTEDSLRGIARYAAEINRLTENIGARRLHTVLERVLDDLSFEAPERKGAKVVIDATYVDARLKEIAMDQDLSRYIL